ncbi:MAG: arginine--tRNA ligase [Chloroflexota bacterium]|jgi:arginyl-tRNA synthetase
MFELEQDRIGQKIKRICQEMQLPNVEIQWKWIPFSGHWGIATSFFQLAALEARQGKRINVNARAVEIAMKIAEEIGTPSGFEKVEAVNGYLNLYFQQSVYAEQVVDSALALGSRFGQAEPRGEQVMVEFSQPNTHKAMHVGHLRSAILGDVLSRILAFAGYAVVRANYPGDMGLHVIKWLWCYMNFHPGEKPAGDITRWMGDIYAEASRRLEENPALESDLRALYARWDRRDPPVVKLWEETRQWSLDGFNEIYRQLDIHFDIYYFNSQMEQPGKEIVNDLIARGIAIDERPNGAVVVKLDDLLNLENEKYRVLVVLRSDNTALYSTEDLALVRQKFYDYPDLTRAYYVVDVRQSLHFQQVFKTMEIAGFEKAAQCQHVPYELVNLPGNVVMSSREGTIVLLEDLIREAVSRALEVVREKNPDLSEDVKQKIATAVGVGAIKYPMLARENTKVVTFDWETALDFNGQAAPYIQYAYVRAGSILRKFSQALPASAKAEYTLAAQEVELINLISRFSVEVQRSATELRPLWLATYAYELAKAFNDFYTQCPVLQAEEPMRGFRLRLTAATRQTIANSLALLGITAPQAM